MREHAASAMGSVPANSYLGTGLALARWGSVGSPRSIEVPNLAHSTAENDYTPLARKRDLAAKLKAELVGGCAARVTGTPFDSVEVTNASLLALLTDHLCRRRQIGCAIRLRAHKRCRCAGSIGRRARCQSLAVGLGLAHCHGKRFRSRFPPRLKTMPMFASGAARRPSTIAA